ncbi:MAG TPA: LysO family transporter [Candidatus Bacteroides merdipullorum]|uniref:LysO family transporter n=1 Tax=Candidatus Bacteroides merdipullorum TaxID=2838474 RepID=A0A9D2A5Q3_9BACE|nr:LysO family transporter [Candidatus Bacteroides merdipullorum]
MFSILLTMAAGGFIGYLCRHMTLLRQLEKSTSLTVFLLLFVLGLSIGSNHLIIDNLSDFGWQAAVLATAGTAGSILAAALVLRLFFKQRKEES